MPQKSKTANSSQSSSGMLLGALVILSVPVMLFGNTAKEANDKDYALNKLHMAELRVPAESVKTRFLETPAFKGEYSSGGKASTTYRYWTFLETKDWIVLNGGWGKSVCPQVLSTFMKFNESNRSIDPAQMDALTIALRGKEVELMLHVPRFKAEPKGLDKCLGVAFDKDKGVLMLGGKPLGMLADRQPGLLEVTKTSK